MISDPVVRHQTRKNRTYATVTWACNGRQTNVYCGVVGLPATDEKIKVNKQLAYLQQAEIHMQLARDLWAKAREV